MADYVGGKSAPYSSAWPWLTQHPITQTYGVNGETGIDLGTPFHTPITSLNAGQVLGTGYYGGGGVVSVAYEVNGKAAAIYYQHLDTIADGIVPGAAVTSGQTLGLSGGQLSGGSHPSSPQYSSGPHTEVGFNAPYGSFWNPKQYAPNFDPLPTLAIIVAAGDIAGNLINPGGIPSGSPLGIFNQRLQQWWQQFGNAGAGAIQVSTQPGFIVVAQMIHDAETFRPLDPNNLFGGIIHNGGVTGVRMAYGLLALLILLAVVWHILSRAADDAIDTVNKVAPAVGAVASTAAMLA